MLTFLYGMVTMGFIVASMFFVRFWRQTHDTLFALFGIAFALFALNQALTTLLGLSSDEQSPLYLLRLAGFALIIVGVLRKNFAGSGRRE